MGLFHSRQNAGIEEVDISTNNAYRYPPKSGCYFGSHFIMGGERFDTTQPEAYLFGENADLNFLGNRPTPFPYPAPQANEPIKTLKSVVNIRKDSVRFVRAGDSAQGDDEESNIRYNVEFTLDCDVPCAITIFYFATEEISSNNVIYHPRDPSTTSETYHYKSGANQQFIQSSHMFEPKLYTEEELVYNQEKEMIPIVIQCQTEDTDEYSRQLHMTFCIVEKSSDGGYLLKPLKQRQMVDGLCYLLQEIYGIENKNTEHAKRDEDEIDDNGSECVICMSEVRDTLILPCRHLCLCNCCADSLRYQANNCPICRSPFRALLQIRALRKKSPSAHVQALPPTESEDNQANQEGVPPGYEAISLIEALNGPTCTSSAAPAANLTCEGSLDGNIPPAPPSYSSLELLRRQVPNGIVHGDTSDEPAATEGNLLSNSPDVVPRATAQNKCETPELIMTGVASKPVKESGKQKAKTRTKDRTAESTTEDAVLYVPQDDRVEIVNETAPKNKGSRAKYVVSSASNSEEVVNDMPDCEAAEELPAKQEQQEAEESDHEEEEAVEEASESAQEESQDSNYRAGQLAVEDNLDQVSGESCESSCSTAQLLEEEEKTDAGSTETLTNSVKSAML